MRHPRFVLAGCSALLVAAWQLPTVAASPAEGAVEPDTTLVASMTELGSLGGDGATATDVDGSTVIGTAQTARGVAHAFAYDLSAARPRMRDLGVLPGDDSGSRAEAISGTVIVGTSYTQGDGPHGFVYDLAHPEVGMRPVGSLGGGRSTAVAVDGSVVVGAARTAAGPFHAFAYDLRSPTPALRDLGTLPGDRTSAATAVSGSVVVGTSGFGEEQAHAFAYDLAAEHPVMRDLGTLSRTGRSEAVAVDGKLVVGTATTARGERAFVVDLAAERPVMRNLGTLGGSESQATAVSGGVVVGSASLPSTVYGYGGQDRHAFAVDLGAVHPTMRDLSPPGGLESRATAVAGSIVVGTVHTLGGERGFAYDLAARHPTMTALGTLPGRWSEAVAVSGRTVVGSAIRDYEQPFKALAWQLKRTTRPVLQFNRATYQVEENVGRATVTVVRRGDPRPAVTVRYAAATTAQGPTEGVDFAPVRGTLAFAAGQTLRSFSVSIRDDRRPEGPEWIRVALRGPAGGALLGTTTRTSAVIIGSSDQQPDLRIRAAGPHRYVGARVFSSTGRLQMARVTARPGQATTFYLAVSTSMSGDRSPFIPVVLRASSPRLDGQVTYLLGGRDVSGLVASAEGLRFTAGSWTSPVIFKVVIPVPSRATSGSRYVVTLTGTWRGDITRRDTVEALVVVR